MIENISQDIMSCLETNNLVWYNYSFGFCFPIKNLENIFGKTISFIFL
jgi:hypothetical protein